MQIDPCYPDLYLHFLAQSLYSLARYADAIDALEQRLDRNPDSDISHVLLAACYGRAGRIDEARKAWERALVINPAYSIDEKRDVLPYRRAEDFDALAAGLRQADLLH